MAVISSVNATQVSTNTSVLVTGSIIQAWQGLSVAFTIVNSGADTISYIVYGGNASDLSDKVSIQSTTDILAGASGSYSAFVAPFAYYGIYVKSKVNDTPGTAVVRGVVKG